MGEPRQDPAKGLRWHFTVTVLLMLASMSLDCVAYLDPVVKSDDEREVQELFESWRALPPPLPPLERELSEFYDYPPTVGSPDQPFPVPPSTETFPPPPPPPKPKPSKHHPPPKPVKHHPPPKSKHHSSPKHKHRLI